MDSWGFHGKDYTKDVLRYSHVWVKLGLLYVEMQGDGPSRAVLAQGLLCDSFLGLLWFSGKDFTIRPKKELHCRFWVRFF